MDNELYRKPRFYFLTHKRVQVASHFLVSALFGVSYGLMIDNDMMRGIISTVLPSTDGSDIHQYLPVVIMVLIYLYLIRRKLRGNLLEKISFSCLLITTALISFISSLVFILML
ncbi:hypothetical protein ASD24_02230 [Paenibacillus sp. Root52]|uniref:hypothetical protein n=1 Tax=Paenibacillus sp. Root52 TaxID=1736552 RepID=UPI0006F46F3E|nr:hypothetical protein [Paenibacillus sp. Root52]KQY94400.1 hypothetical protein ASD24_02230 [Paenibacillus sp. Root52]